MTETRPRGCLSIFLPFLRPAPPEPLSDPETVQETLPYKCVASLLSPAERSFFGVLAHVSKDHFCIVSKVRLADILTIPAGTERRQHYFNRIQSKHIDFLLCDRQTLRPMLAIELDDSTHKRKDRKDRDAFLDAACTTAALPLLHVTAAASYNPSQLRNQIGELTTTAL